ncbi:hypothetical protein [Sorangium sp. So ce388]|uniref:hypothetical protein n=1 Tax=Sorangium sp. So ce388 TaxID=3133309 RepID=UPI003F5C6FEB
MKRAWSPGAVYVEFSSDPRDWPSVGVALLVLVGMGAALVLSFLVFDERRFGCMSGIEIGKTLVQVALRQLAQLASKNDEQLHREREELALQWSAELKAAVPQAVAYLESRVDDLDARIAELSSDPQLRRVYTNFNFEAHREAIDERRRMLAHAAAGLINPEITVERKARVERTLRALDPADILMLHGANLVPGRMRGESLLGTPSGGDDNPGRMRADLLLGTPSGDVLASSGCVRMQVSGGGAGQGVWTEVFITQLGLDVLTALRTYTQNRKLSFVVPGREYKETDRTEEAARKILAALPGLGDLVSWSTRRSSQVERLYDRPRPTRGFAVLRFRMCQWQDWKLRLENLIPIYDKAEVNLVVSAEVQARSRDAKREVFVAQFNGPHDLLRYPADDCEALWT